MNADNVKKNPSKAEPVGKPAAAKIKRSSGDARPKISVETLKVWLRILGPGVIAGLLFLVVIGHVTYVKYWFDPARTIYEFSAVQLAPSGTKRAETHLSIAENRLMEMKKFSTRYKPNAGRINKLSAEMVRHDHAAMVEMDKAKKSGVDIRYLVTRLCDGLEDQMTALKSISYVQHAHNAAVTNMWDNVEAVENGAAEFDLSDPIRSVGSALDKAMEW